MTAALRTLCRLLLVASPMSFAACSLPSLPERLPMSALSDTDNTRLGSAVSALAAAHPGRSGVYPLAEGGDAFAARALLAAAAERSIDAQYYIWHDDVTGRLLFDALCQAADRGVRVRLLLDDNSTAGLDPTIAALAAHRNIFVRLFNPLVNRRPRWTNYLYDFSRVNHRMHNKSFTVDGQVTIVGGRNVADEYFDVAGAVAFADLDVIAVGPVVREVSSSFDLYWNSASAYPALTIVSAVAPEEAAQILASLAATRSQPGATSYLERLRASRVVSELGEQRLPLEWTEVRLVEDDPRKVFAEDRELLMLPRLLELTGKPAAQFDLVSPYLVLMENGTASLAALAESGVRVRVLTNSLASNDVAAVHAGYAKHRKALLRAGIALYELEPRRADSGTAAKHGSSAALHAKTFQVDGARAFVGSFNFDPRSAHLNTELGFVIESPQLAGQLSSFFDSEVPQHAYQVELNGKGDLQWIESTSAGHRVHDTEPETSAWRRGSVHVLSVLPIDWLL
jgi:cardiolipin synthase C